jgi:hypothetical protein
VKPATASQAAGRLVAVLAVWASPAGAADTTLQTPAALPAAASAASAASTPLVRVDAVPAPALAALWLKAPLSPELAWRGQLSTESAGGVRGGAMVYPGGAGLVGLLVGVFTHAAIEGSAQSAARRREQEEADKVLEPYRPLLRGWDSQALWQAVQALDGGLRAGEGPSAAPQAERAGVVQALPVFTLVPDESALVLDVAVKLEPVSGAAAIESTVRVVSTPLPPGDPRAQWSADEAVRLKRTAAAMFAHALRLAQRHSALPAEAAVPQRTLRYVQGTVDRTERGQPLEQGCNRVVMRTLRGGLMSVPQRPADDAAACTAAVSF